MVFSKTTKTTEAAPAPAALDPWPECNYATKPARTDGAGPADPPTGWHKLSDRARGIVGIEVMRAIAANPTRTAPKDYGWLAHRVLDALRSDPKVMRELQQPNIQSATILLASVVRKLVGRDALLADLRRRQAELGAAIASLERVAER